MTEQSDEEILQAILAQLEAEGTCRAAEAAQLHSILEETMTTLLAIDERLRALDKRLETMPE